MFVRVRMPLGEPHRSILVIDRAIGFDQGLKFVYVVDAENHAQRRRLTTRSLQEDRARVIETVSKPMNGSSPEHSSKSSPAWRFAPETSDADDGSTDNPRDASTESAC